MTRKALALKRIGGQTLQDKSNAADPDLPLEAGTHVNVVMVERLLLTLLRNEVDRFSQTTNQDDFEDFMRPFFDPLAGEAVRKEFVTNFQRRPPTTVLGYPRTTTEMPCFSIVLENEEESDNVLADGIGSTKEGEKSQYAHYVGAHWRSTFGVYVYAEHPDVCAYLYQFAKMILFGAKYVLRSCGFIEAKFSGGELAPEESAIPENLYMRVLRVTGRSLISIPKYAPDPGNFRVLVHRDDVVVEGVAGKVKTYEPESG